VGADYVITKAATANVKPATTTSVVFTLTGADLIGARAKYQVNAKTDGSAPFKLKTPIADWHGTIAADTTGKDITVSKIPVITTAKYNPVSFDLTISGTDFDTGTDHVATKFTIVGKGDATYTLTAATANKKPATATSLVFAVDGADKAEVAKLIDLNGLKSSDDKAYKLKAAAGWDGIAQSPKYEAGTNTITAEGILTCLEDWYVDTTATPKVCKACATGKHLAAPKR
jgi:hypothetical protein